ncbi:MAG TPA: hypothetical protein VLT33_33145, partial [Labilithrix sp.]|nr:hypothetical protein [Labilithrix sp.]
AAGGVAPRGVSARSIRVGLDGVARVSDFGAAEADVRAMGVVLWEALTGVRLREGGEACAALDDVSASPVVDPRTHVKELPAAVVEVVMRALAPAPESRHPSAEAMAEALTEAARAARLGLDRREIARAVSALTVSRTREAVGEASGIADPTPTVVTDTTARARPRLAVRLLPVVVLAAVAALTMAIPLLR